MTTDTQSSEYLRGLVERLRAGGHEPGPELLRQLDEAEKREANIERLQSDARERDEAERAAQQAQDVATRQAIAARAEEKDKAETRTTWLASGGKPEEFEAAWPELRKKIIEQRTLAAMASRPGGGPLVRL